MITITDTQDCYNIAYNYLKDKYGYRKLNYTNSFYAKLRMTNNAKQRKELLNTLTDNDYNISLNPAIEHDDKEIELLLSQYYFGFCIKAELRNKLLRMKVVQL